MRHIERNIETVTALSGAESFEGRACADRAAHHTVVDTRGMFVRVVEDLGALDRYESDWEDLAANSLEPNPFYEHWMLMPAIRSFAAKTDLRLVLVFAPDKARPSAPPVLCGLFPIERRRSDRLPVKVLSLWKYIFCMICTPLVRVDCARESLAAFFDWLETNESRSSLMEFQRIAGEGLFYQLLVEEMHKRLLLSFTSELYTRAMLVPSEDTDAYLRRAMSRQHRKDLRRKQKRLAEAGCLEFDELQPCGSVREWAEEFMQLEMSGWKGKTGGALQSNEANRAFFIAVASEAFYRGRLMMMAARVNGKAVAEKCNFLAGEGSFAFKIAYDESYAQYSPGMILEIENIRHVHHRPEIKWMDSCAIPDHPMINRLWPDRRTIQTVIVPTRKGAGDLLVSILPLARWLRRKTLSLSRRLRHNAEEVSK